VRIEVFNTTRSKNLPFKKLAKAVENVLVKEKRNFDVNLIFVGTQKIRKLNNTFRNQDKPTDVLSFLPDDSEDPPLFTPTGEIYICVERAKRQAYQAHHSLTKELLFLSIHGSLHLCGYTHETDEKYKAIMSKSYAHLKRLGY